MLNYQRAKENRARRDFLRERCYLWGIILGGLGERLNGIQEVMGSSPTISTKRKSVLVRGRIFGCIIHFSIFIIHYSLSENGFLNE